MTDLKCGIPNIKKKIPVLHYHPEPIIEEPSKFQKSSNIPVEVSDYNSKAGRLVL